MKDITVGLRGFNEWLDEFLIEASTRLLMIGFVAGTVDVFTQGILSTFGAFNIAWAVVQAIALDGLFFAVWGRIARAEWTRSLWRQNAMLVTIGVLLAIVAMMVNGILSYQELMAIGNVKVAMASLHVDQTFFTAARSFLVVIVAIFVALFCRSQPQKQELPAQIAQETVAIATQKRSRSPRKAMVTEATVAQPIAIAEKATIDHSLEDIAHSPSPVADENGYVAQDDGYADSPSMIAIATGSHRDRIRMAMAEAMQSGQEVSYVEISQKAGVGYSTVKKWAPAIRQEIEGESDE